MLIFLMGEGSPVMADFIPHTPSETREMLKEIGVDRLEDLLAPYPKDHVLPDLSDIPSGLTESSLIRRMQEMASRNKSGGSVRLGITFFHKVLLRFETYSIFNGIPTSKGIQFNPP